MRNAKLLTVLLGLVMLGGCIKPKGETNYFQGLQGDWTAPLKYQGKFKRSLVFSFRGHNYCYLHSYSPFRPYSLTSDTLTIHEEGRSVDDTVRYHFRILRVDEDSLYLEALPLDTNETYTDVHGMPDTFKLQKMKPKHKAKIERIGFYSTTCFGTCPAMYLELDSLGNMLFLGLGYTELEGTFSGKIPGSVLHQIIESVHNTPLESLQQDYIIPMVDIPTYGLKLVTADDEYETELHGDDNVPVELTILVHDLMELYKSADLKMDSTIRDKRQLRDFRYKPKPPPPPPISLDLEEE